MKTPQSIVLAPDNMIYIANTGANQVIGYAAHTGNGTVLSTAPYTLVSPNAVAVDSSGDLFIGDSPTPGVGRVLEIMATNGILSGPVSQVVMGGALQDVTALAVNPTTNTLYVGDDLSNAIFTVASGSHTPIKLNLTGVPAGIIPAALAFDTTGNLYIADFLTTLYELPAGGTLAAETVVAPGFVLNSPTGLAFDRKGDLYILTLGVPFGTTGGTPAEQIVEIPGEDLASAFLIPLNSVGNGSGLATDTEGNLYVTDLNSGNLVALFNGSPIDLFDAGVGAVGDSMTFNYEFNATVTLRGFRFVSEGDTSTEVVDEGGTCSNGKYTDGNNGGPISPSNPALCQESFAAQPAYAGLRTGAVELRGTGGTILNTTPVYSVGTSGASVVYPLTASAGATVNTPEGLAVSGLDKKLYIVNAAAGAPSILSANGPDGKTLTTVNTGGLLLGIPYGIAINGAGDLYVADFAFGLIDVIPAVSAQTPYSENPGSLLQHPLSVAFDYFGNLYIGDSGPDGSGADAANPGYIVEVPADGGAPFKVNTGAITVIYPLSLTTDPYTGDLYIGDGGDPTEAGAEVVKVAASTGAATVAMPTCPGTVTVATPSCITQPVGLAFDPAEQLYVLDQNLDSIAVLPTGGTPYLLPFDNSLFTMPVGLAITSGGQSLVESNVTASTSNSIVYLNGLASPLAFGSVTEGQHSSTLTATVNNIGNLAFDVGNTLFHLQQPDGAFRHLGQLDMRRRSFAQSHGHLRHQRPVRSHWHGRLDRQH